MKKIFNIRRKDSREKKYHQMKLKSDDTQKATQKHIMYSDLVRTTNLKRMKE